MKYNEDYYVVTSVMRGLRLATLHQPVAQVILIGEI